MANSIPIEKLIKMLSCDFETGCLWRVDRKSKRPTLACKNGSGYFHGYIDGVYFQAHRVVWALYYHEWPEDQIDHINHIRTDNRIQNLRSVTGAENLKNKTLSKKNISGVQGVYFNKQCSKWVVQLTENGVQKYLGMYPTIETAAAVRNEKIKNTSLHENHGLKKFL